MEIFLGVETSTTNCSVALFNSHELIDLIEVNDGYSHSENIAVFVDRLLNKNSISVRDLNGIAVGIGPGSYTGLRIGVSFVKGLAYTHNIPVVGFTSLELLVASYKRKNQSSSVDSLFPMIDARRMEVYTQPYDPSGTAKGEVRAMIIDEDVVLHLHADNGSVVAFGSGAQKLKDLASDKFIVDSDVVFPSAKPMYILISERFKSGNFLDVAYFEPFYLKEFVAGKPKKVILRPE